MGVDHAKVDKKGEDESLGIQLKELRAAGGQREPFQGADRQIRGRSGPMRAGAC
jgi:hypothetical protein